MNMEYGVKICFAFALWNVLLALLLWMKLPFMKKMCIGYSKLSETTKQQINHKKMMNAFALRYMEWAFLFLVGMFVSRRFAQYCIAFLFAYVLLLYKELNSDNEEEFKRYCKENEVE